MIFNPACPNAGPTGGAGFACPALITSLIEAVTAFAFFDILYDGKPTSQPCTSGCPSLRPGALDHSCSQHDTSADISSTDEWESNLSEEHTHITQVEPKFRNGRFLDFLPAQYSRAACLMLHGLHTFTVVWAAAERESTCRRSAETLCVSASMVSAFLSVPRLDED